MELEPDFDRLSSLGTFQREERSGTWWVSVIVIGVLLGNVLSFGAYMLYVRWETHQIATAAAEALKEQTARLHAESERLAKTNALRAKERQKKVALNQQLRQTCEFWKEQVRRQNTPQNRAYRDAACARASSSL